MSRTANLDKRNQFLIAAREVLGNVSTVTRADLDRVVAQKNVKFPQWLTKDETYRVSRGVFVLPQNLDKNIKVKAAAVKMPKNMAPVAQTVPTLEHTMDAALHAINLNTHTVSLVPDRATGYVPFGHFADVRAIIKSGVFYPIYITGQSGNGKTMMVEQTAALEKREVVRVNITIETDEDDLIGGFRLVDGKTVWQNGPVIVAMERGAVLLLDEVDLGSNKLMCLQPILEGKPIYLKKINKVIHPMPGFNIVATANTKGKGSDDGRFIGTNVMNEAFLERFSITLEQEYPELKIETKILNNVLAGAGVEDNEFVDKLVIWADAIRKAFYEGSVTELISTRRLVHICQAYTIFGRNREKAITLCLNRFEVDTKNGFLDLYKKLDGNSDVVPGEATGQKDENEEIAF
jgi:hypothetical protein